MDKLHLLQILMNDELVVRLNREELHLFLLMVAASNDNGEGKILPGQLRRVLGNDFSLRRFNDICAELGKKGLITVTTPSTRYCTKRCDFVVAYRIVPLEHSGINDTGSKIGLKSDNAKSDQ